MSTEKHKGERIAKRIARAGICSRREAEAMIEQGRVSLNGAVLTSPAVNVQDDDDIVIDGKALPKAEATRLFLYHKPTGLVTSRSDEKGRATVFASLPPGLPRVVSVGRLDLNTEGLLLLTNDGGLARYLELPATGWQRRYRVRVHGHVDEQRLEALKNGITIEGIRYRSIIAKLEKTQGSNAWLNVQIREGKNREIRKVMESMELKVNRLIRTDFGPFSIGTLTAGSVAEVPPKTLRDQIAGYFKKGV